MRRAGSPVGKADTPLDPAWRVCAGGDGPCAFLTVLFSRALTSCEVPEVSRTNLGNHRVMCVCGIACGGGRVVLRTREVICPVVFPLVLRRRVSRMELRGKCLLCDSN